MILSNLARSQSVTFRLQRNINTLTVIGSGLMGSGIAQVSAQAGIKIHLVDSNGEALDKARTSITRNLGLVAKKRFKEDETARSEFVEKCLTKLSFSTDLIKSSKDADLIIEAIIENLQKKQELFKTLDECTPTPCIFATNTSSLLVRDVGSIVKRRDRFLGLHFFNPVPLMRLLEVVRTSECSDATLKTATDFGKQVGKTVVHCNDTPGFVVNRLLVPSLMEAMRLYERGDATFKDIDIAMKLGAGHPMGPFELADYVGLDTVKFIMDGWHARYPDEALFRPCDTLDRLVSQGKLGRKSSEGFYVYDALGNKVVDPE